MSFIWQPARQVLRRSSPLPTTLKQIRLASTDNAGQALFDFLGSRDTQRQPLPPFAKEISAELEAPVSVPSSEDYVHKTIPYPTRSIPQKSDPLSDFFVNLIMKNGHRLRAIISFHKILEAIHRQTKSPPLPIFKSAIVAASPFIRLKSIKKGAKIMIVPVPMTERQRTRWGIKWILAAADKRSAIDFDKRVAMELLAVLDGTSSVLKQVDERHKVAMMNRSNLPRNL
ncbi:Ribosomal protein S7 [Phaffia rhodozyma]|uniref:Ribosomal protein S7 n=1 Tax=Phaffia rhodozyma TaxID=264483 RepID=A0A0F7SL29_PHARH|nr:Ribosomal protein S7 [Phaffia rhodozyma]